MRIVHIFFSYTVGGAELMLLDIMNLQVKEHEVSLVVINDVLDDSLLQKLDSKIKVYLLRRKKGSKNPIPILKLNWLINTLPVDVIHCHVLSIVKYIFFSRKDIYATKHNIGDYNKCWYKYKKIFAISNSVFNDIISYGNFNVVLAPNGISMNNITERKLIDFAPPVYKIISVGRLVHHIKGQDILLDAIRILIKEKNIKNIIVDFIGEGDSLLYLKNLTKKYEIDSHVSFLGLKDQSFIYKNLSKYDIFVQPSRNEGFGLSVVEAIMANIPVVISNIDGPMEIVGNGEYGFFFENGNSTDLAFKLQDIIQNYKLASGKAKNAIPFIAAKYNIENTKRIYENNYT